MNPTHLSILLIKLELIRELINSLINMEHHGSSIKSPKFASMLTLNVLFKCHFKCFLRAQLLYMAEISAEDYMVL